MTYRRLLTYSYKSTTEQDKDKIEADKINLDMYRPFLLFRSQKKYAERIAIFSETEKFNYEEYFLVCHQLSLYLQEVLKIKEGDYVLIYLKNSCFYIFLIMSLQMIKAVAVHLNSKSPQKLVEKISQDFLNKDNKTYLIADDSYFRVPGLDIISIEDLKFQLITENVLALKNKKAEISRIGSMGKKIKLKQITNIIFTSASSGPSKAVVHSYKNHYYSALGSNLNILVGAEDCWLLCLPLYHVGGLSILYRTALKGASIFIPKQDLSTAIKEQRNVTHISMVAAQVQNLFKDQAACETLLRLKGILIGGGRIPSVVIQKARQLKLNLFCSYGSSEMSSQISTTRYIDKNKYLQNCGKPLRFRELKVNSDQEIWVRGAVSFEGYFRDGLVQSAFDKQGWFHTKDLGEMDEHGFLKIYGRKDNMFISGGENIYPEEIEEAIMQLGLVERVRVLPIQDPKYGMRPAAFIEIEPYLRLEDIAKKIENLIVDLLPRFKLPAAYFRFSQNQDMKMAQTKSNDN